MFTTRIVKKLILLISLNVARAFPQAYIPLASDVATCPDRPTTQHLTDLPYENYFYSDCHVSAHAIVTTPQPESNLTIIGPRLIVAWPAGNSGACAFFEPRNGKNGSLSLKLINSSNGSPLRPIYRTESGSHYPRVGVKGIIRLNASAVLTIPILGSVRTIRDFVEGPSLLAPKIQDTVEFRSKTNGGVVLSRLWLDNVTIMELGFTPGKSGSVKVHNRTLEFEAGDYEFHADYNYPQLKQLNTTTVLNENSKSLVTQQNGNMKSLTFLSYSEKLLAGAWRFLTYFGRDSMISALLLQPMLSDTAIEAVIGAVLERINSTDGTVAHEETIGDYATYLNEQMNITGTAPSYNYIMIDTDFYLPVLLEKYFLSRKNSDYAMKYLKTKAGKANPANSNYTYYELALKATEKIMKASARYAADGNQTKENLIHLKDDVVVGQWRDSTYGIGGGRIPYDVNCALVPAALRSIYRLSKAGLFPTHPEWTHQAKHFNKVWENTTLRFFSVKIAGPAVKSRLDKYKKISGFPGPTQVESISGEDVNFHALALDGNNGLKKIEVMNTDDCFRLFLINDTNQIQASRFISQAASNVRRRFPAGLMTDIGLVVANPAYGLGEVYASNWTTSDYHGTVVWSWQLAMMAKGFENQLERCHDKYNKIPLFCRQKEVHRNVVQAYNVLWDSIEKNKQYLSSEVWSWVYRDEKFVQYPLGALPPQKGVAAGATESDIRQLWSLTFLAIRRNTKFR